MSYTTDHSAGVLSRLTGVTYPNGDSEVFTYDAAGNRTRLTQNGATTTYTYDAANRMTAAGADTYTYDASGNQTSRTAGGVTTAYTFDGLDRLTAISAPGLTAAYAYNGDNLRVARTVNGVTERDTWATVFGLPQVLADGQSEYVWAGELVTQYPIGGGASSGRVVAADRQGSERLVLSSTGSAIGSREYDAYGNIRTQTGTSVAFDYTGNRRDAESGLLYLRARLYDPATGRFLSPDPAGDCPSTPLSAHAYLYGLANPARYTDPLGLSAWDGPAPSTTPGDYPGAQPYLGVGKPPAPDIDTQPALDDGICSANEPGLCLQTIMDLRLGAKYIHNYDQFVWTRYSPWSWIPKAGCKTICNAVCSSGLCFVAGVPLNASCAIVCGTITANPIAAAACAATCGFYWGTHLRQCNAYTMQRLLH